MDETDMRRNTIFVGGVHGEYYEQYIQGTNAVLVDPDATPVFATPNP